MATWRVFTRTVYTAIAVMILMASPDVSFAAEQPSCEAPPPHIVVVGSVNVDLTVKVARPPALEETVTATDPRVSVAVGGKGANQAVAAARLVAGSRPVRFVGQFGGDSHASMLEEDLVANGVDVSLSGRHPDLPRGRASSCSRPAARRHPWSSAAPTPRGPRTTTSSCRRWSEQRGAPR